MNHKHTLIIISLLTTIFVFMTFFNVNADDDHKYKKQYNKILCDDDDHHHKRKRKRKRDGSHSGRSLKNVKNTFHQDNCGECHFAYQPGLMPSDSWSALMNNLDDHFGESIELDEDSIKKIADYLNANSAEKTSTKIGTKIIRSIKSTPPMRITEIPYILHKHHEISPDVFNRESIGSFSNCTACHTSAEDGIYDDDYVRIPR